MSENTIRDLFRSLEVTLHERLRTIEDVMRYSGVGGKNVAAQPVTASSFPEFDAYAKRVENGEGEVAGLRKEIASLRAELSELRRECSASGKGCGKAVPELIPHAPLEGIEIITKRDDTMNGLSIENRLLLNKKARAALEAEEMGEHRMIDHQVLDDTEAESDAEEGVEAEEEAEAESEAESEAEAEAEAEEEEEAEEEAEEVELEEFEYKGSTYYRDGNANVFMTDEDGELVEEPVGTWNEAKQRIIVKKSSA
jgi:hypothetical protein